MFKKFLPFAFISLFVLLTTAYADGTIITCPTSATTNDWIFLEGHESVVSSKNFNEAQTEGDLAFCWYIDPATQNEGEMTYMGGKDISTNGSYWRGTNCTESFSDCLFLLTTPAHRNK
jgi:hypothetical protein